LEKIEMKKTLVAVAALTAVAGAMAEVTISGFLDQSVNTTKVNDAGTKTSTTSVGANAIGQDQITFGVSEDIGGGMTAFAATSFATDASSKTLAQDMSHVGIKGAFGSLKIGSDYDQVWYTENVSDASGWGVGVGNVHGVGNTVGSQTGSVIYTLPAMIEGVGATIEKSYAASDTSDGDAWGYGLSYSSGPLMAKYAYRHTTAASVTALNFERAPTFTGLGGAAVTGYDVVASEGLDGSATANALALTYDFGTIKLHYGNANLKVANGSSQKITSSTYGVSMPVGAFSIGYAYSTAKSTDTAGDSVSETGNRLLVKYAFSKRTNGYVQYGKQSTNANQSASGTGIGITHSF